MKEAILFSETFFYIHKNLIKINDEYQLKLEFFDNFFFNLRKTFNIVENLDTN